MSLDSERLHFYYCMSHSPYVHRKTYQCLHASTMRRTLCFDKTQLDAPFPYKLLLFERRSGEKGARSAMDIHESESTTYFVINCKGST